MNASWVGSSVGLLAAVLLATPISEAFRSSTLPEDLADDPGYEYALTENAPLFDTSTLEPIEPIEPIEEEPVDLQRPRTFRLLPRNWNPIVRHATEPSALVLLGTGLLGIATLLRRRQRPSK